MKKTISLSLAFILTVSLFVSCKKGENDPSISLLSRKARLTGVWDLTSADYQEKNIDDGDTDITSFSYDGTNMTETTDGEGETYIYSEKLTIEKDGNFTLVVSKLKRYFDSDDFTWKDGVRVETITGVWYFLEGNEQLDVKDKERVEFLQESYKRVDPNGDTYEYEFGGKSNTVANIILLDRLSKNEIVTMFDFTQTWEGNTFEKSGTMTYEKQ